jgi:two-component system KDP operon response regulator KdpE
MTADRPRVLLIEDEPEIRQFMRVSLHASDYVVQEAATGREGLLQCRSQPPDIVVLDLGLPDISGFEVIQQLRAWSGVPIIIVSARGQEADKVAALDAGADDYLTKPFGVSELLARLRVMLRRQARADESTRTSIFATGNLSVDFARRQVLIDGQEIHLTPTEYRILTVLIKNAGKVLTHRQLLQEIWGPDCTHEVHYLRVYMNQLRRKLGDTTTQPKILTEPGVGYRFCATDSEW